MMEQNVKSERKPTEYQQSDQLIQRNGADDLTNIDPMHNSSGIGQNPQYSGYYQPSYRMEDEVLEEDEEETDASVLAGPSNLAETPFDGRFTPPQPSPRKMGVLLDQDRFLPIANVNRIMKRHVDPSSKLAKEAKQCIQECVSEFISFISSEAADYCHQTQRKTITADDLLTALEATGFDNYSEPMQAFLQRYRQVHKLTGPVHRVHPNYQRPEFFKQFAEIAPLYYNTEHGRKCTTTTAFGQNPQYHQSTSVGGVAKKEWKAGEYVERQEEEIEGEPEQQGDIEPEDVEIPIASLEQQDQMQIYVDANTKQHYAAMETPQGIKLYPIKIQSSQPITLTNVVPVSMSGGNGASNSSLACSTNRSPPQNLQFQSTAYIQMGDQTQQVFVQKTTQEPLEMEQNELDEFIVPNPKTEALGNSREVGAKQRNETGRPVRRTTRRS